MEDFKAALIYAPLPRSGRPPVFPRLRSGCGRNPDRPSCASLGVATTAIEAIAQARRFPPEGGAVSVCSTKTRTAALSVRTRRYPGRAGYKRIVRSISASSWLMATLLEG